MAARLVWRRRASRHLQAIFDYISTDNVRAASDYANALIVACERLRDFPLSGRVFDTHHRILVVRRHLVFYSYDQQNRKIVITAIIDGRRDVAALLRNLDFDK